jgi:FtsH-binding integral membrane protein
VTNRVETNIRRHVLVDMLAVAAGSLFAASVIQRSIGFGTLSFVLGIIAVLLDIRNIGAEEQEVQEASGNRTKEA